MDRFIEPQGWVGAGLVNVDAGNSCSCDDCLNYDTSYRGRQGQPFGFYAMRPADEVKS